MSEPADLRGVRGSAEQGDSERQEEKRFWDLDKRVENGVGSLVGEENKLGPQRWARDSTRERNHGRSRKKVVSSAPFGFWFFDQC